MRVSACFLIALFLLAGCSSTEDDVTINATKVHMDSPMLDFLGTWELKSQIIDGEEITDLENEIFFIEEDNNLMDSVAIGYFEGATWKDSLKIWLTDVENEIRIKRQVGFMVCTYNFVDENTLELDDSTDQSTMVTTWSR